MGGGAGGDFGNTSGKSGNVLDALSGVLAAISLIPGIDTFADAVSIPVDLLRGDLISAGLDLVGIIPFVGEVADTANIARKADKAIDAAKTVKKTEKTIKNPVVKAKRVGSANKIDKYHNFNNIVDNYVGQAQKFKLKGSDGKTRTLYQLKGSLNGKDGIFEWIFEKNKGVTHRRFIDGGSITGKPNAK